MNGEDVPRCVPCDSDFTVEYILIECGNMAEVSQRHYDTKNLQLFHEISVIEECDFSQGIGVFYRIYMYCLFMATCE